METSLYRDKVTPRGFKYHYYFSPSSSLDKPTLLFLHGFPSTSYDWRHQATFFIPKGYGVLIPDLLGYGGTDKPTETSLYVRSEVAKDVLTLLDEERIEKAFAIGHDTGAALCSSLANLYPDRFLGFAFLSVGYMPPAPDFNLHSMLELCQNQLGREPFGYWLFFAEDGADKVLEEHIDSFLSLLYPNDPKIWLTEMGPRGALKAWVTANKRAPRPDYLTEEDLTRMKSVLLSAGLAGPLCWYKVGAEGYAAKDDALIPRDHYTVNKPTFFAAATQDQNFTAESRLAMMQQFCPNLIVEEYDTDHWVQLAAPDQLNRDLMEWFEAHKTPF